MNQKNLLSAIIIAKNEELRIGSCIDALSFCNEVLVADNGSTDDAIAIAQKHKATVIRSFALDFATLRNAAAKKVSGNWILYVDADEVISKPLAESIRLALANTDEHAPKSYRLMRINYYLGNRWPGNEWMHRLFQKDSLLGWKGKLHETAITEGKIGNLSGELIHDTHRSLEEMVSKTNEWSQTEAMLRLNAGHPRISWWRLLRVTFTGFFDSFFRRGGWKAGEIGWIESIYQGFSLFITYAKLWEKQESILKK